MNYFNDQNSRFYNDDYQYQGYFRANNPQPAAMPPQQAAPLAGRHKNVTGDGATDLDGILLNPKDCVVLFIDHEPQMYLAVRSHEPEAIRSNTIGLAKACKVFNVPTILTTVDEKTFSGITLKPIREALGNPTPIDRTFINAWQDPKIVEAVKATGRRKVIISALWTELCGLMPALSAKLQGYEVYIVTDACGGATKETHERAVERMIQAGVIPVTWEQVMLEWQRDWARTDTAGAVLEVAHEHGGAYGIGIEYQDTIARGQVVPRPMLKV